jgi:probable phosphoglycerate mutase
MSIRRSPTVTTDHGRAPVRTRSSAASDSLDAAPGGEPAEAFAARVANALNRLADRWAPGPIAVVAHEAVNRHALARLVPSLGPPGDIRQHTGCWNRLERAPIVDWIPGDGRQP